MNDLPLLAAALRELLAAQSRPRCVPVRATGRTLVGRRRRVVPVTALGRAV
ncbi:hypothetical protein [Umezawaea sp.]|uniref:hypothetical protein n=1 Tax=Umezawaea sp. TaxID=1955258 RepID=UPI002ED68648